MIKKIVKLDILYNLIFGVHPMDSESDLECRIFSLTMVAIRLMYSHTFLFSFIILFTFQIKCHVYTNHFKCSVMSLENKIDFVLVLYITLLLISLRGNRYISLSKIQKYIKITRVKI